MNNNIYSNLNNPYQMGNGGNYPYSNYMPSSIYNNAQNSMNLGNYTNNSSPITQMSFTNGIEGAKGYSLAPNSTIFLMDSDAPQFFIKTSDRNGMCTIKAYKFEEMPLDKPKAEVAPQPEIDTSKFITREEFNEFTKQIMSVTKDATSENNQTIPQKKTLI